MIAENSSSGGARASERQQHSHAHRGRTIPILSVDELFASPDADYLIDGILPLGGLAALVALPHGFKSSLAIEMACSVAAGEPCLGRKTHSGPVVYIAAEGQSGIKKRVRAWCKHHGVDAGNLRGRLHVVPCALDLLEAEVIESLLARIGSIDVRPVLIVNDTLARCIGGGDKNEARDMGRFINGCATLGVPFGATVLIVHHTGKTGKSPRGSSALEGGVEAQIRMTRHRDVVTVTCDKQKEDDEFASFRLRRRVVDLGLRPDGRLLSSIVLVPDSDGTRGAKSPVAASATDLPFLRAIWDLGEAAPSTTTALKRELKWPKQSFYNSLNRLITRGFVASDDTQRPQLVRLLPPGLQLAKSQVPDGSNKSPRETHGNAGPKSQHPSAPIGRRTAGRTEAAKQRRNEQPRSDEGDA